MRDLAAELKALRLYGMAEAWAELAGPAHGAGVVEEEPVTVTV